MRRTGRDHSSLNFGKGDEFHHRSFLLHNTVTIAYEDAGGRAEEGTAVCGKGAGGRVISFIQNEIHSFASIQNSSLFVNFEENLLKRNSIFVILMK